MLTPEIQAIVDMMAAAPGPPAHEVPIAQARAAHDKETAVMSGPGDEVDRVDQRAVPGPGGEIPVRVFTPKGAEGKTPEHGGAPDGAEGEPLPLVAYVHGGGWVMGTIAGFDPLCRALANAARAIVASIEYRLAPEHPFPAALGDVHAAVRWLHANAAEFGADPDRLAIAGDSAGGNLATITARRLRDEGGPPIRYQALIYPVTDSALNTPSYREKSDGFGLSALSMQRYWRLYLDGADGGQPDTSPLRTPDLRGMPPAYILTVEDDVLRDEGEAYAKALEEAGVPVTLRRYEGPIHGFFRWLAKSELAREAVDDVAAALRSAL